MNGKKKSLLFTIFLIIFLLSHYAEAQPRVIKDIEAKGGPLGLAIDEKNERLFVLNYKDGTLSVINEKDLSPVQRIPFNRNVNPNQDAHSVAYDPGLNRIFLTTGLEVFAFEGSTYKILFEIKGEERYIPDLSFVGGHLYLLDWYGYIHKYSRDGKLETSIEIKDIGDSYMHRGPSDRLYISSGKKGLVVVDGKKGKVVATVPAGGLSIPESSWNSIYVADSRKLYVINAKSLKIKRTIDVQMRGNGLVLNPNTGHLFLVTAEDTVTVINPEKGKKVDKLKVCSGPQSIAINKETNTVYVACPNSDTITVIKDSVK